jgi:hypothetical protein
MGKYGSVSGCSQNKTEVDRGVEDQPLLYPAAFQTYLGCLEVIAYEELCIGLRRPGMGKLEIMSLRAAIDFHGDKAFLNVVLVGINKRCTFRHGLFTDRKRKDAVFILLRNDFKRAI